MGRWAQRRIRGGGPGPELLTIIAAVSDGDVHIEVQFTGDITAAEFTASAFRDETLGENAIAVVQGGSDSLVYTFVGTTDAGHSWTYSDTVSGILTPETGEVT